MLPRALDMKIEAVTLAAESVQLRREGRKALRNARYKAHNQQPSSGVAYHTYHSIYLERMDVRRNARLHHLARMLLKGKDYADVEAYTYERVNAEELSDRVWQWDPSVTQSYVDAWLGRD